MAQRPIHPDFQNILKYKEQGLIDLYTDLRHFILEIHPNSVELLYHTHALTSLFTVSEKMSDGFCLIPIYTNHLNLGFSKGTLLDDPKELLKGTGKWMRHIPISMPDDYRTKDVESLLLAAIDLAMTDTTAKQTNQGLTISKIKN